MDNIIDTLSKKIDKLLEKKAVAVTAGILVVVILKLSVSSLFVLISVPILVLVAILSGYKIGSKISQEAKFVRKGRTYVFLGYADCKPRVVNLNPNLKRLMLGAVKYRWKIEKGVYGHKEITETKHKVGIFKIHELSDDTELVVGREYLGHVFMRNEKPVATLMYPPGN